MQSKEFFRQVRRWLAVLDKGQYEVVDLHFFSKGKQVFLRGPEAKARRSRTRVLVRRV